MVGKEVLEDAAYHSVRSDPAVERWTEMHSTMYQRFRFTPKRTRQFAMWGLAVPLLTYYAASYTNVSSSFELYWILEGKMFAIGDCQVKGNLYH
jgi:hypothetical protein